MTSPYAQTETRSGGGPDSRHLARCEKLERSVDQQLARDEWRETSDEMDHIHAVGSLAEILGAPLSRERYEQRDKFRRVAFERFDRYFRGVLSMPALDVSRRYVAKERAADRHDGSSNDNTTLASFESS